MKRMFVATMVLSLAAAMAQAGVTTSISFVKTATVPTASGNISVDIFDITQTATGTDPNSADYRIGAVSVGIGTGSDPNLNPTIGEDPFQIWKDGYDPNDEFSQMGDYWTEAYGHTGRIANVGDNRRADTRFTIPGLENWAPAILAPSERNDQRYGTVTGGGDNVAGLGEIYCTVGVPILNQAHSMTIMQVGVVSGKSVYGKFDSADANGGETHDNNVLIPEPATLSLLGLGALAILRRRR